MAKDGEVVPNNVFVVAVKLFLLFSFIYVFSCNGYAAVKNTQDVAVGKGGTHLLQM